MSNELSALLSDWHELWNIVKTVSYGIDMINIRSFFLFISAYNFKGIYQRSADGYDTTVQRRDVHDGFLAVVHGESGEMLREEHGGPRLVFPSLYGWKSAKFLKEVAFLATDDDAPGARRGFWEKLGCHPRGRWAEEQRWAPGTSAVVWNALAGMTDLYRVVGGVWVWERVMVHGGRVLGAIASTWETVRRWWRVRGGRVGVKAE